MSTKQDYDMKEVLKNGKFEVAVIFFFKGCQNLQHATEAELYIKGRFGDIFINIFSFVDMITHGSSQY